MKRIVPFNAFYKEKIDLCQTFLCLLLYGWLHWFSFFFMLHNIGRRNLKYVFPFHLSVNLVHPKLSIMSNIVALCGVFMALLGVFIFLFSWCVCSPFSMPIWSNACPPVSWSLFLLHKYWQILARWQRQLIVEGKGLVVAIPHIFLYQCIYLYMEDLCKYRVSL